MAKARGSRLNALSLGIGVFVIAALVLVFFFVGNQNTAQPMSAVDAGVAHAHTAVPPGELDEYYLFASGGHSGQVYVYGIPSMRRIRTIPVFTPDPVHGWGWDDESRAMLGGYTWGDVHHVRLSMTDGEYDGRWLFVNDNANNRVARIDLDSFAPGQIIGPLPNTMGPHCAAFITPNSEYLFAPARFSAPIPHGTYASLDEFGDVFWGVLSAVSIEPDTGHMDLAWQLKLPPWNWDKGSVGKGESDGWGFVTAYNTEEATTLLEVNASQHDKDYVLAFNWRAAEQAIANGQYEIIDGAKVLDPVKVPGIAFLLPAGKSPHGVDVSPDGRWIVASGKLSPTTTVFDWLKVKEAVENGNFQGYERGLPILSYEDVRVAEVPVGLGPLHTDFDNDGYAYTSLFLESAIVKWQLETWEVLDKVNIHYNTGHLAVAGGSSMKPYGEWLVTLNKLSKDRFIGVGPSYPENLQLISISGEKMELVADAPSDPEPHYAEIIPARLVNPLEVFPRERNDHPYATWSQSDAGIERNGNEVTVRMTAVRSRFTPDVIEVNEGDHVTIHVTNIDQEPDITHGLGISLYDIAIGVDPGQTKTVSFVADKPGVYTFYCTDFCSALHQEMSGFLLVKPKDEVETSSVR